MKSQAGYRPAESELQLSVTARLSDRISIGSGAALSWLHTLVGVKRKVASEAGFMRFICGLDSREAFPPGLKLWFQGRCTWVNPAMKVEDDSIEEAEAGEKDERPDEPEPEYGPPLLTNLSQDAGQSF